MNGSRTPCGVAFCWGVLRPYNLHKKTSGTQGGQIKNLYNLSGIFGDGTHPTSLVRWQDRPESVHISPKWLSTRFSQEARQV